MRRTLLALAAGAAVLCAPITAAQAQTTEQRGLAKQVTEQLFGALDFETLIVTAIEGETSNMLGEMPSRPEWSRFLKDALREEAVHDQPAFEELIAQELARQLTAEELEAGADLLGDPSMRAALRTLSAGGKPTVQPSREAQRIATSPAGRAFMGKMMQMDQLMQSLQVNLIAELLPGTLRRFADKVEAGERVRKTASPP